MKNNTKFILVMSILLISTQFMVAQNFNNLIGERASSLDSDLNNKGYYHIETNKSGYDAYSSWWNYSSKKCVMARVSDGRVKSIRNTVPADCNKSTSGSHYNYYSKSHKSYEYGDKNYGSSKETANAFERGYNDGLYNKSFHNIWKLKDTPDHYNAYNDGYDKGVNKRKDRTSYHSGRGGFSAQVYVQDLKYKEATAAYRDLISRGFKEQKNYQDKGVTYKIWYNNETSQCIKTYSRDYKIFDIKVSTHCK